MRTFHRLVAIALSIFIAVPLSLPADAQPRPSADQLLARQGVIENNLRAALATCDQRRFNRGVVELRAIADVVWTSYQRERDQELKRQLASGVAAPDTFRIQPALNLTPLWNAIMYWEQQGRELAQRCARPAAQTTPPPTRIFDPSRNHVSVFLEGGASFGHSTLAVDPGAFVPVNETLGSGQGFVGGGFEFPIDLGILPRGLVLGAVIRGYFINVSRSFSAPPVSGDVRHSANWAATGYIGFPQVIARPPALPFAETLTVTPVFGIAYEEDTLKSVQTSGGVTNVFEKTFGRVGATVGLNFDIPAGNFSYGLTTGLTMLPSTTVNGISSLGLPAQAKIDSQANLFIGGRITARVFPGVTVELTPPR